MSFWGIPITTVATATDSSNTDVSTVDTIARMRGIARMSSSDSRVVGAVQECLDTLPRLHSQRELMRVIYLWIRGHVTFEEDESILSQVLGYQDVQHELLISPPVLLSMPSPMGDCDDYSMLSASMLLCASIPVMFVVIACDENQPWRFSHVYCKAFDKEMGTWIPFDASHGKLLGWQYQGPVFRRAEWYV